MKKTIFKLNDIGAVLTSVTCDNTQVNITMLNCLGANISDHEMKVTLSDKNCKNGPIFVMLDTAHLIKLVRNTLGDLKTLVSNDGELIRWQFIQELYELQTEEGLHLANKLRKKHQKRPEEVQFQGWLNEAALVSNAQAIQTNFAPSSCAARGSHEPKSI